MIIYLKRLKSSKFVRVKAFPMYGGIGVSAPSLHRESTDSLIFIYLYICVVRVARYRIASKCFYAFLFRRGEKYRKSCRAEALPKTQAFLLKGS